MCHNSSLKVEHSTVFQYTPGSKLNTNVAGSHQDSFLLNRVTVSSSAFLLINPIFSVMYALILNFSLNTHILFLVPSSSVSQYFLSSLLEISSIPSQHSKLVPLSILSQLQYSTYVTSTL